MASSHPRFFVVARVVGREGSFQRWKEILNPLCEVSATEELGTTYYWGQDLDGEQDTLWGLEGYTHAVGFYLGHPASDIFKREMGYVAREKLLKIDDWYDLKHYDVAGGFLTREDDIHKDEKGSHVAILHFWAHAGKGQQEKLTRKLCVFADKIRQADMNGLQSCGVLRGCWDLNLVSLWVRTRTEKVFKDFQSSVEYQTTILKELAEGGGLVQRTELHKSRTFIGHIDRQPLCEQ